MYTIKQGDALEVLRTLEANSIDCCVTSPPYWGLRDYGTAEWEGGDPECDHVANPKANKKFGNPEFNKNRPSREETTTAGYFAKVCPKCGAIRKDAQLGLEPTPEEYVAKLVAVFEEVRRVLKPQGTLWLNLGDSYASAVIGDKRDRAQFQATQATHRRRDFAPRKVETGLKPKNLVGIPWRVAFALQAAGWWLRSDIIWAKDNPMPESVTDRPTKSHEYLFLLAKSERYYYDKDAIAEKSVYPAGGKTQRIGAKKQVGTLRNDVGNTTVATGSSNARSVWRINTAPFAEAHFATFPLALPERCIRAGCPVNGIVLDPFGGSGTTAVAALRNNRRALLIELNPEYVAMAHRRIERDAGGLQQVMFSEVDNT